MAMEGTEVVVFKDGALEVTSAQYDTFVKSISTQDPTKEEITLFFYDCARRGIHPLDKLLYFTKRKGKYTPVTSIDYFRMKAESSGVYAGSLEPVYVEGKDGIPSKCTITVRKIVGNTLCDFSASYLWKEIAPDLNNSAAFMWKKMPHHMLAKCTESLALRKAFPGELHGLYISEEMDQAGLVDDSDRKKVSSEKKVAVSNKQEVPASEDIVDGEVVVHPEDMDGGGVHETAEQPEVLQKMVKIWIGDKYVEKPAHDLITQKQVKWFQETFGDKPKEEAKPTNGKMNAFHLFGKIGGESKGTMGRFGRTNFISPKDPKDAMTFGQFASLVGYSYWCAKDEEHGFLDPFYFEDKITESIAKKLGATVTVVKEVPTANYLMERAKELLVGANASDEDSPLNVAFGNKSLSDALEFQRVMIDQVLDQVASGAVEASDDNAIIGLLTAA